MHLVMIGGSDAGISAALRARELDPGAEVTVVAADAYPNFSICGIPYYVSGEVTHWRNLAHRTTADLEATGMRLRLDTTARRIDVPARKLAVTGPDGAEDVLGYDKLIVGTGAVPVRPPIGGLTGRGALGPGDGVHLLHSMGDTFAVMRTLETTAPATAVIVGAGYIGLARAGGCGSTPRPLTARWSPAWRAWCWSSSASAPTPNWPPAPAPPWGSRTRSPWTGRCTPISRTSLPPGTASSPTTGCSARPTCR